MAILDDPRNDSGATARHTLTTWGVPAEELERRLALAGLADAGVEIELMVIDDDGLTVHLGVAAAHIDRLNWGVGLVQAGVGEAVLGDADATLEGQVVELLARQGLT